MKKFLIGMLILVILICNFANTMVYADTPKPTATATPTTTDTVKKILTLEVICDAFNNQLAEKYNNFEKENGYEYKASCENNKLYILISDKLADEKIDRSRKIEMTLKDNILSGVFDTAISSEGVGILRLMNSIGILYGYDQDELYSQNASLEKDGYEQVKLTGNTSKIQIDISRKPVFSNNIGEILENGFLEAAKSVENAKKEFEANYEKEKDAIDETRRNVENAIDSLNKNEQKQEKNDTVHDVTSNTNETTNNTETMPKTGKEQNPILIIPYVAITFTCIGIIALIITRKR